MPEVKKISCEVPEFIKYNRPLSWYFFAIVIGAGLLAYAVLTSNFLFAIILVLIIVVMVLMSLREPKKISLEISPLGIRVGGKKYDFTEFKDFSIIYQPPEINTLYLEFRMPFRERLSVQLGELNPNEVRAYLLNFLAEDLEREEESLSDILSRILRF